jgi:hypothetical protein
MAARNFTRDEGRSLFGDQVADHGPLWSKAYGGERSGNVETMIPALLALQLKKTRCMQITVRRRRMSESPELRLT